MASVLHNISQSQPPAAYESQKEAEVPAKHQTIKKIAKIALGAVAGSVLTLATSGAVLWTITPLNLTGITYKFMESAREGTSLSDIFNDFKELTLMKKVAVLTALFVATASFAFGLTATIIVSPVAVPAMLATHLIIGGITGALLTAFPDELIPRKW